MVQFLGFAKIYGPVLVSVLAKKAKKPDWTGLPSTNASAESQLRGSRGQSKYFTLPRTFHPDPGGMVGMVGI